MHIFDLYWNKKQLFTPQYHDNDLHNVTNYQPIYLVPYTLYIITTNTLMRMTK